MVIAKNKMDRDFNILILLIIPNDFILFWSLCDNNLKQILSIQYYLYDNYSNIFYKRMILQQTYTPNPQTQKSSKFASSNYEWM